MDPIRRLSVYIHGVALLVAVVLLIVLDVAAWFYGVDSRDWGRDPRSDGRPRRWI